MGKLANKRGLVLMILLLSCAAFASAEPFADLVNQVHTWYVANAVAVTIILLAVTAVAAWASDTRRASILVGGFFAIFVFNMAGVILSAWSGPAT